MLTHSKRFSFKPNILMKPLLGADPLIVSTLQTLGDKLRDDKFCELAVISTKNQSVESAIKWILNKMQKSRQTPSLKPKITQSTSNTSPILVAASPVQSGIEFCDDDDDEDDDIKENTNKRHNNIRYNHSIPPLSIGKSSYNDDDDLIAGSATATATLITITPTNMSNSHTIGNLSRARSLLSRMDIDDDDDDEDEDDGDREIISMSPTGTTHINHCSNDEDSNSDADDSDESRTPTPPSFGYKYSNKSTTSLARSGTNVSQSMPMFISSLLDLDEWNLCEIIQYLTPQERIQCGLCSKFMNDLVFRECNFGDIWFTFESNKAADALMRFMNAQSISPRDYKNCVSISLPHIQFEDDENGFDFTNIATRNRNQNNYKIVRFHDDNNNKSDHNHNHKINKRHKMVPKYLNKLWIWNAIHCLELQSIYCNAKWQLLCSHKLSRSISFLSVNMMQSSAHVHTPPQTHTHAHGLSPDAFHLICKYFPHLEYLNLCNFHYISPQYRDAILEFFKLRAGSNEWERVESSLLKLKAIQFESCNDLLFKLLSETTVHLNINPSKFVFESLFTQLIVLQMDNCDFESITHLQILLNGCCAVKYLSLCNISIARQYASHHTTCTNLMNGDSSHRHISNSDKQNNINGGASFIDRVERTKLQKQKKIIIGGPVINSGGNVAIDSPPSTQQNGDRDTYEYGIRIEYLSGVPIIKIPKSVKYLQCFHKFNKNNTFSYSDFNGIEMAIEESMDSHTQTPEYSASTAHTRSETGGTSGGFASNQSTPVLFAMDGMDSPQHKHMNPHNHNKHAHHKHNKSIKYKIKAKMDYPLPPFYCNLSRNRKKLVHVNAEINDGYLINQLFAGTHLFKSLKYVLLNYSCAEHNGYLNFAEFVQFYSNQYTNYNNNNAQNNNITMILNNALYDEYKLSLNKIKCTQFFKEKFNKNEEEIIKEEQFNAINAIQNKYGKVKNKNEMIFLHKLTKCTDFFKSRMNHHF